VANPAKDGFLAGLLGRLGKKVEKGWLSGIPVNGAEPTIAITSDEPV
jgi:hypothetical protein